jgi:hypothetical protein
LARCSSAGLQPSTLDSVSGGRRSQKLDRRAGAVRLLCGGGYPAGDDGRVLYLGRQRPYHIDAINMQELAYLLETNLDLATGDDRPDGRAERYLAGFRLDIAGNTHALEESGEIGTALAVE